MKGLWFFDDRISLTLQLEEEDYSESDGILDQMMAMEEGWA